MSLGMLLGIAVAVAVLLALAYNSLIAKRNQVNNVFATVDVLLKKRYDLIPNLVSTVQGYAQHERTLMKDLTELRGKAAGSTLSPNETIALNTRLGALLGNMRLVVENYPDLKASKNFLQLQAALNEVEEQISAGRRAYNAAVTAYNNAVQMVPLNLVAGMFGFRQAVFFEAAESDRAVPSTKGPQT